MAGAAGLSPQGLLRLIPGNLSLTSDRSLLLIALRFDPTSRANSAAIVVFTPQFHHRDVCWLRDIRPCSGCSTLGISVFNN
jgi:hypothetical protein